MMGRHLNNCRIAGVSIAQALPLVTGSLLPTPSICTVSWAIFLDNKLFSYPMQMHPEKRNTHTLVSSLARMSSVVCKGCACF